MDQQRRAELAQDLGRLLGPPRAVGGDPDVPRLALAHRRVERAHRLLERRLGIEPVRVEDVDVVEAHAGCRLCSRLASRYLREPHSPYGPGHMS